MENTTQLDNSNTQVDTTLAQVLERLDTLETQLAYQEHWLDSLSETITQQQKVLTRLERMGELMQQKMREQRETLSRLGETTPWQPEEDVPPHY